MKRLAAQEAERMNAGAAGREQDQLRFWEEKAAEIEQNSLRLLRAELEAATKRLELCVTSSLTTVAENLRADNLEQTAKSVAELVKKIGDLIVILEALSARTDKKLGDLAFRVNQMQKIVNKQQEQIMLYESLIKRGDRTAESILNAAQVGAETMWLRRGRNIILSFSLIILVTVAVSSYLQRLIYQPTWQVSEGSNYWEVYTHGMTEEQKTQLIEQLRAKQRRIEQEEGR
jgi:hypothetical protein